MSSVRRPLTLAVAAGAVAVILFATRALPSTRAISVAIVLFAGIALTELFHAMKVAEEASAVVTRRFDDALRPRRKTDSRLVELERVERDIVTGAATAVWADQRLIPRLRAAAAARLAIHHGIGLERNADAARELLGEDIWELLRPDRPKPAGTHIAGIPPKQVRSIVDRLEAL